MKYDRLLRVIKLIQYVASAPGRSYDYYAEEFNVSARTIRRDVNLLAEAGLPVETSRGIRFVNDVKWPELSFDYKQSFLLLIALNMIKDYINFNQEAEEIKEKILEVVSSRLKEQNEQLENRIKFSPLLSEVEEVDSDKLTAVFSCLIDNRRLKIKYGGLQSSWRKIDPYGIYFQDHNWYLVSFCHRAEEIRTYLLAAIEDWQHLREYFKLPDNFELKQII